MANFTRLAEMALLRVGRKTAGLTWSSWLLRLPFCQRPPIRYRTEAPRGALQNPLPGSPDTELSDSSFVQVSRWNCRIFMFKFLNCSVPGECREESHIQLPRALPVPVCRWLRAARTRRELRPM